MWRTYQAGSAAETRKEETAMAYVVQEIARRFLRKEWDKLSERERRVVKALAERAHLSRNTNREFEDGRTLGERVADRVAAFGGSWTFIFIFCGFLFTWMIVNSILLGRVVRGAQFDPYPYILLNLMLSMTAALQAPIIMMSQNRAGEKDRLAAENDFRVNLKSELMLEELTRRMERLQNDQIEELLARARARAQAGADNGQPGGPT